MPSCLVSFHSHLSHDQEAREPDKKKQTKRKHEPDRWRAYEHSAHDCCAIAPNRDPSEPRASPRTKRDTPGRAVQREQHERKHRKEERRLAEPPSSRGHGDDSDSEADADGRPC